MRSLRQRLHAAEGRLAGAAAGGPVESDVVGWLRILELLLPAFEGLPPGDVRDKVVTRMRASIGRLTEYAATSLPHDPWPQLEYYCHACLLRLQWKGHGWDGRPFAFAESEYDTHMAEIERIERSRRGVNAPASLEGPSPSAV